MINSKHSYSNASWAQCPSNGVNTLNGGYSGEEREGSNEIIVKNNHRPLIDDDDYSGCSNINSNA